MQSITQYLSEITGNIFKTLDLPENLGIVRASDRPDLCQFQCNGAMAAAKIAKKNPREIASHITEKLQENSIFSKVEIAGPGFINLNVTDEFLAAELQKLYSDDNFGAQQNKDKETVVLDYGGPNVAKAMHVGHLRAAIIGDSIRRIMNFCGYKTLGDVHLGDWGTPMGMIISELERRHSDWPYFDENKTENYPSESPVSIQDLEEIYPAAASTAKEDPEKMAAAQRATVDLQQGRAGYRALWRHFVEVSIKAMKVNYENLGVYFDLWKGEADVHDYIAPMFEALKSKDLCVQDDGAWIVPISEDKDSKEIPPLLLYKRDGAVMYGTTDMATIVERMKLYDPTKIIYVVDQRQSLHFEQVFRAVRKAGIAPSNTELTHAGFGTMNGKDGKPFKTRAGGVMKLEDLIQMGLDKANERMKEADIAKDCSDEERADIAHKVAIAAIKFADLQNNRSADYVFDLDRLTSFEGKTGPYLLYQAVRIKSLLRKAKEKGAHIPGTQAPAKDAPVLDFTITNGERELALILSEFPDHFSGTLKNYTPHILCDYAYKLAQTFSSFYSNCHILSEENEAIKNSRLGLCAYTVSQLECVLSLLGIEIPERM